MKIPLTTLLATRGLSVPGANDTILTVPTTQPKWAEKLSPQIGAFSIEMDHWQDWAGDVVGNPNSFVNTALGHLSQRTGAPVYFRVGGE